MKYRKLGKTGLKVSVIGVGTWQFGGEWGLDFTQPQVDAVMGRARDVGINLLDTAECYGDHLSEKFIGKSIEHERDKWVVATKVGHRFLERFKRSDERTARDVVQQFEASLKALRTDHVDLLQYHSIRDSEFDDADLQAAMIKLKEQGKVLHIGTSLTNGCSPHQVLHAGPAQVETVQLVYNRLERKPEQAVLPECIRQNLGVLARVPLASGFLSGKYKPGHVFGDNDVRHAWVKPEDQARLLNEVLEIGKKEVPAGVPMAQWALAWCLSNPAVTCVIPGCKNVQQVESNAAAADLDMVSDSHPQAWSQS